MVMKSIVAIILFVFVGLNLQADEVKSKGLLWSAFRGLEYRIKAGFNFGGTSPLPLPVEIRKIEVSVRERKLL